jgi:cytochrome P450
MTMAEGSPALDGQAVVGEVFAALATRQGRHDPYPHYARLRALGPAARGPGGIVVVSGYRLATELLREHKLPKAPDAVLTSAGYPDWRDRPGFELMYTNMLFHNPPEHTRLRRLVAAAFTPRRVSALRPAIERSTARLCDQLAGECDFVTGFAFSLPVAVIGELLGVPTADRPMFEQLVRDWTNVLELQVMNRPDVMARADAAAVTIRDYFGALVARRRAQPADDLVSAMVTAQTGDRPLSDAEAVRMSAGMLAAGFGTTTAQLANGLLALLRHPDQAARLRAEPALAEPAVEELLRYDPAIQVLPSGSAPTDLVIGDLTVSAGSRLMLMLGAANRDATVFDAPDELRLDRTGAKPLSFGGGIHYCLGAALARLELQVALPGLLTRFPKLALCGEPVHREGLTQRMYLAVPIDVGR